MCCTCINVILVCCCDVDLTGDGIIDGNWVGAAITPDFASIYGPGGLELAYASLSGITARFTAGAGWSGSIGPFTYLPATAPSSLSPSVLSLPGFFAFTDGR